MRDLTEEELKLAPEWATHYTIDGYDDAVYQSKNLCWWVNLASPLSHNNMDKGAVGIIKKPFDITKHEVANHITVLEKGKLGVFDCGWIIDKGRAIAIAKALGVTGEDLK